MHLLPKIKKIKKKKAKSKTTGNVKRAIYDAIYDFVLLPSLKSLVYQNLVDLKMVILLS